MAAPKEDSALELTGKTQPLRRSYSKDTEPLIFKMGEENLYRKRLIAKGIGEVVVRLRPATDRFSHLSKRKWHALALITNYSTCIALQNTQNTVYTHLQAR